MNSKFTCIFNVEGGMVMRWPFNKDRSNNNRNVSVVSFGSLCNMSNPFKKNNNKKVEEKSNFKAREMSEGSNYCLVDKKFASALYCTRVRT